MFQREASPGVLNPIVTPSGLEEYKDAFRDMVVNYPEAWHLLVQVGGTGTTTDLTEDMDSPKKKNKSQKERLKKQLAKEREKRSRGHSASPLDPKGERGPKRDSKGRFLTDRSGMPICFAFNNAECKGVCSKNMVHICQS